MAKAKDFSQSFAELENIVKELESGAQDLNLALKKYEQGLKLAQTLKAQLQEAENKIRVIKDKHQTA